MALFNRLGQKVDGMALFPIATTPLEGAPLPPQPPGLDMFNPAYGRDIFMRDNTLTIDLTDGDTRTVRRTTTQPVRRNKTTAPARAPYET